MDTVKDFEDILELFERHGVRYLIVGGMAFIYHAKPRYTKDIDLWIDPDPDNVRLVNQSLTEFGSPELMSPETPDEILQLGVAPNRIDLLRDVVSMEFSAMVYELPRTRSVRVRSSTNSHADVG